MSAYIYGRKPILEAIESGQGFEKIFLQQSITGDLEKAIRHYSKTQGIPYTVVPKDKLDRLVQGNHQGVIGVLSLITYHNLEDFIPHLFERSGWPLIIILDQIQDGRNVGAIARCAWALGVDAMLLPAKESALLNEHAMKSSAGALNHLPLIRVNSLSNACQYLKNCGFTLMASDLRANIKLAECRFDKPCAILLGSEETGLAPHLLKIANERFIIPMIRDFDSLNVSVAAGIIFYEIQESRKSLS